MLGPCLHRLRLPLGLFVLGLTSECWGAAPPVYNLTAVDSTMVAGFGINDAGQVAGEGRNPQNTMIFGAVWTPGQKIQEIQPATPQGDLPSGCDAIAINDTGMVAGKIFFISPNGSTTFRAFVWTIKNGIHQLGTLDGIEAESADSINNDGQVVGSSSNADGNDRAFIWTTTSGMQNLGTLGGNDGDAFAINNAGQVVGSSTLPGETATHAFLWTAQNGMTDLGTPGGLLNNSVAFAISSNGLIAGYAYGPSGQAIHAFLYSSGTMHDLGALGGNLTGSTAWGVNSSGQVVGWCEGDSSNDAHAFVYTDGIMYDLNKLNIVGKEGWSFTNAHAINDVGQITGWGTKTGSKLSRTFVLTPIVPPRISTQPASLTVKVGHKATFKVTASGTGPFSYQWYRNGKKISGATNATSTISTAAASNAGTYTVIVTNPAGKAGSDEAKLTVK
ncbi:MAG: immunoglobulin domain-containing protein [Opitutales bacterium]|jgi:probable HAF family extracellular repeat protein